MNEVEFITGVLLAMKKAGMVKEADVDKVVQIITESDNLSFKGIVSEVYKRLPVIDSERLISKEPVYLADFRNREQVLEQFAPKDSFAFDDNESNKSMFKKKHKNIRILFAFYSYEDYTGKAFVLFENDGKLYEVHGSHCSCFGLEGQWEPEEVDLNALKVRLVDGSFGEGDFWGRFSFKEKLMEFLEI